MATETTVQVGAAEIEIESVDGLTVCREDGGDWLIGVANIEWRATVGGREHKTSLSVKIGCWRDTDDDHAEWCAANEGARIIEACITARADSADTRGGFARLAFPAECEAIGRLACEVLRADAD